MSSKGASEYGRAGTEEVAYGHYISERGFGEGWEFADDVVVC